MPTSDMLSKAGSHWKKGQALEAGKLIFESLPVRERPQWAARVLRLVLDRTGVTSQPIERAISITNSPNDWGKAHDVFSALREATLELLELKARTPQQALLLSHLGLAELVAKVTYNSTSPPDEFDEDSGWWIAPCLKDILDMVNDKKFSAAMWSALSADEVSDLREQRDGKPPDHCGGGVAKRQPIK
jgi:hypothetical protein